MFWPEKTQVNAPQRLTRGTNPLNRSNQLRSPPKSTFFLKVRRKFKDAYISGFKFPNSLLPHTHTNKSSPINKSWGKLGIERTREKLGCESAFCRWALTFRPDKPLGNSDIMNHRNLPIQYSRGWDKWQRQVNVEEERIQINARTRRKHKPPNQAEQAIPVGLRVQVSQAKTRTVLNIQGEHGTKQGQSKVYQTTKLSPFKLTPTFAPDPQKASGKRKWHDVPCLLLPS